MQLKVTLKFEGVSKALSYLEICFSLEVCLFPSKKNINYQIKVAAKKIIFT